MTTAYPIVRLQREQKNAPRKKGSRKPFFPAKIPYQEQIKRLGTRFDAAFESVEALGAGIEVANDPRNVVPERALVFELLGKVGDFEIAAQALGFEWLRSDIPEDPDPDDEEQDNDDEISDEGQSLKPDILYLTMPSLKGLKALLAQWNKFKKGLPAEPDQTALWKVFGWLADLRVWSPKDRIDPSLARYIDALLGGDPTRHVQLEIDFWYRSEKQRRDKSIDTLSRLLVEVSGKLLDFVDIPEIQYQGALVSLPASVVRKLTQAETPLARLDDVMTIRPQSHYLCDFPEDQTVQDIEFSDEVPSRRCITALLDGYPVLGHDALKNRVVLLEVDVSSAAAPANMRVHGTAMASLVLHGDLQVRDTPLTRKVVMIPVLAANTRGQETIPTGKMPIGVVYRALCAIVENRHIDDLSNVTIVNHSICDTFSPFCKRPSPWATLLDHFSYKHQILFVVSAGNIAEPFPVPDFIDLADFQSKPAAFREAAILQAINKNKGARGILSPAESINGLTVGALHADGSSCPSTMVDPFPNVEMTNLASAVGFGVNRSIKPDLVEEGGRFAAGCSNRVGGGVNIYPRAAVGMGHKVASPSPTGDLKYMRHTAGTSNAAALITRSCNRIADAVEDAFNNEGMDWLKSPQRAVILKTLLVHASRWGSIGSVLEEVYPPQEPYRHAKRRDNIAKFLGYGRPGLTKVISGADNRVTLLAHDSIVAEQLHEYRIPVPSAMIRNRDVRSVTLTLSWTAPILPTSADYRGVALSIVDEIGKTDYWQGVARTTQPNSTTSARGTVIHITLEGKTLVKVGKAGGVFIGVQATARHTSLAKTQVPYALAITLEMAQSQKTGIYAEVRDAIRARSAARSTARV